ncbi:LysE family translocator [Paenirhodobacter populi]|uniref:LysE family translocator n=1 Tax=Paenirhodobacter populi TaxID=2306993 RepID=A0A443IMD9_9RHOB|nr:LysE family translocator [Sinirhodobacter populi]RWR06299.1 LysE family translocator [Sinirhodobacter populi]RWR18312.1 LysE family translocator [Sinirhodobacter populi]RWR27479.1 LysE family translocator [Sinirhodobacter populi]RWR27775.1 LysE family translocator [Sinirhodobacter populi]
MLDTLMAFPPATLVAFLLGALVLNFTPGADVLFATASGIQGGPKAGAAAGLGVGIGGIFHTCATAFGLGALVAAHPGALDVVRWFGAAYLLYIAWRSWQAGRPDTAAAGAALTPREAFRRGTLTNLLNPKVMLFMLAYLPQFTDPAIGPIWQQMLILGGIVFCTGTLVTMGYGVTAGWLGARLAGRMGVLNRVAAVMFGGLAAKLVLD